MKTILIATIMVVDDDNRDENDSFVPDPAPNPLDDLLAALIHQSRRKPNPDIWSAEPHGTNVPLDRGFLPALRAVGFNFKAFQDGNLE